MLEIFAPTAVDELLRNKQTKMQLRKFAATLVDMLAQYEMITVEREEVRQRTEYPLNQDDAFDSCREAEQNQRNSKPRAVCQQLPTTNSEVRRCDFAFPEMTTKQKVLAYQVCWPNVENTV